MCDSLKPNQNSRRDLANISESQRGQRQGHLCWVLPLQAGEQARLCVGIQPGTGWSLSPGRLRIQQQPSDGNMGQGSGLSVGMFPNLLERMFIVAIFEDRAKILYGFPWNTSKQQKEIVNRPLFLSVPTHCNMQLLERKILDQMMSEMTRNYLQTEGHQFPSGKKFWRKKYKLYVSISGDSPASSNPIDEDCYDWKLRWNRLLIEESDVTDSITRWSYSPTLVPGGQRELLCLVIQDLRVLKKEKQEATLRVMSAFMLGVLPLQSTGSRERTKR